MATSLSLDSALARIAERDYGLQTEKHLIINQMLHDYDSRLSLRMIPELDPAFRPPKTMGVYEEDTHGASSPWVFTLEPEHVDHRTFARAVAGDMTKLSPKERMELLKQSHQAAALKEEIRREEESRARKEEMLFVVSTKKSSIRHKIGGEDLILSDETRSVRTHV